MEQRFFFGLLMWGEGNLTPNYILFCVLGSLGSLQVVAGTYARHDLTPFSPRVAQGIGVLLEIFAFIWFFRIQPDLFIPGLAGGEFVVYSFGGFVGAFVFARATAFLGARVAERNAVTRESET